MTADAVIADMRRASEAMTDRDGMLLIAPEHARAVLAEIDRLRALPVLRTCGECSKCEELFDAPTRYMCGIDTMIDVSPGAPPPAGCPRRGAR